MYKRQRPTRAAGFFAACGVFFFRFLRLAIVMWIVYAVLFGYVHPMLFNTWLTRLTREVTAERTAFFMRVGFYAVFGSLIALANLIFDYAKVRAVVEDRRSMLGAIRAAAAFARRNSGTALGLYLLDVALFAIVVAAYALVAPGAGRGGWTTWAGLLVGQLYILARLWVKLVFWASETALFQGRLAHAGYVAAAEPTWPDSPAAEAIRR